MSNITVRKQLVIGFGFLLFIVVFLGSFAMIVLRGLNHQVGELVEHRFPQVEYVNTMVLQLNQVSRSTRSILLLENQN